MTTRERESSHIWWRQETANRLPSAVRRMIQSSLLVFCCVSLPRLFAHAVIIVSQSLPDFCSRNSLSLSSLLACARRLKDLFHVACVSHYRKMTAFSEKPLCLEFSVCLSVPLFPQNCTVNSDSSFCSFPAALLVPIHNSATTTYSRSFILEKEKERSHTSGHSCYQ